MVFQNLQLIHANQFTKNKAFKILNKVYILLNCRIGRYIGDKIISFDVNK